MGFHIVQRLAARHGLPGWRRHGMRSQTAGTIAGRPVLLVKPLTFMNRSGHAFVELSRHEPFDLDELLVCYDELALPLGRIRIRPTGSHGGHNGMRSIIARLGTGEFPRLRVGVAPNSGSVEDASEFVLNPFRKGERPVVEDAIERAADAVECVLSEGLRAAMNRYNSEPLPPS